MAFLPFPTSLVAAAIDETQAERAAVIFYGATLFAVSALFTVMGRYVVSRKELVVAGRAEEIEALNARLAPSLGFYAAILALAVVAPAAAAFGFLAVALLAVLRA